MSGSSGYTIQLVNYTGSFPGHTFILITGPNGYQQGWGFYPNANNWPIAPGQLVDDTNHAGNALSDPIPLTISQYNNLLNFITQTIAAPPVYNVVDGSDCTAWALQALTVGGVFPPTVDLQSSPYVPILPNLLQTLDYNPWTLAGGQTAAQLSDEVSENFSAIVQFGGQFIQDLISTYSSSTTLNNGDGSSIQITPGSNGAGTVTFYDPSGNAAASISELLNSNGSESCTIDDIEGSLWQSQLINLGPQGQPEQTTQHDENGAVITTTYGGAQGADSVLSVDQENPNDTSAITTYNADGSFQTDDYSGPSGTGTLTETDQENANGTSQITTFADGSTTVTTYSGPNGTGSITNVSYAAAGLTGFASVAAYTYLSGALEGGVDVILEGASSDQSVTIAPIGPGQEEAVGLGTFQFDGQQITGWNVTASNGAETITSSNTSDTVSTSSGTEYYAPGAWYFDSYLIVATLSTTAGQTQQLTDVLNTIASEGELLQLTVTGAGTTEVTGIANDGSDLVLEGGAEMLLQGGTLQAGWTLTLQDPIVIEAGGEISGYGTIEAISLLAGSLGSLTNDGVITANGGTLVIGANIDGTGTITFGPDPDLVLEGTVAATQSLVFDGPNETVMLGAGAEVLAPISGFGGGDAIELEGQQVASAVYDASTGMLVVTGSGGAEYTLAFTGAYQQSDFNLSSGEVVSTTPTPTLAPIIAGATPNPVEKNQTTIIGTVTPGDGGDTLTLQETAGSGTLSLGPVQAGAQQIIYTAPATISASTTDAVSYTVTDDGVSSMGNAAVQFDVGPSITAVAPSDVEKGQTTVIGTVTPGLAGDTLTLTQIPGSLGTLSLGPVQANGTRQVIYTAPTTVDASSVDKVAYTVTDQHDDTVATGNTSVQLEAAGPPSVIAVTPTAVEKGQTTEIGTVTQSNIGDTLTLTQTGGNGTVALQLVRGVEQVIYTAPASIPTSTTDAVSYTVTENGVAAAGNASVPLDAGPSITAVTPAAVEKGQTTEIGTVSPGLAGDTLSLTQTGGNGTVALQLVSGVDEVIYTAPSSVPASVVDTVTYTVVDQHNDVLASGAASVQTTPTPTPTPTPALTPTNHHVRYRHNDHGTVAFGSTFLGLRKLGFVSGSSSDDHLASMTSVGSCNFSPNTIGERLSLTTVFAGINIAGDVSKLTAFVREQGHSSYPSSSDFSTPGGMASSALSNPAGVPAWDFKKNNGHSQPPHSH